MLGLRSKLVIALGLMLASVTSYCADTQGGRAAAQAKCVQCHEADDWEGESAASLASLMRDIVAGKVKHRTKLDLTPTEIANIAAYWESGGK